MAWITSAVRFIGPIKMGLEVELPFMPFAGMQLKLTPNGDFVTVFQVYWQVDAPDRVFIAVQTPDGEQPTSWQSARDEGWNNHG